MPTIPRNLIDVELEYAGWNEDEEDGSAGTAYPDSLLVDRNQWKERIRERIEKKLTLALMHPYVYLQHPESSCVYNSAAGCLTIRRNLQLGLRHQVILSPMSGYCRVATSRHSGSMMWGALEQCSEYGLLPSDKHAGEFPHVFHENTPFVRKSDLPKGWEATARQFRATEWLRIDNREQFASALLNDMPICYGRSGHSICAEDLYWENGKFLVRYCDSYGPEKGDRGRLYDTERNWSTTGAWACRSVTMPSVEPVQLATRG